MSTGTRVVVVGGGIAGLTAAFRLQQRGFDVIVLEQSGPEWIGGRMGTVLRGEFHIDVGATLLLSSYHAMLRLVVDAGAASEIRTSGDVFGVVRDGAVQRFRSGSARSMLTSRFLRGLSVRDLMKVTADFLRARSAFDWEDMTAAGSQDRESVREYAQRRGLRPDTFEYLLAPFTAGPALAEPEQASITSAFFAFNTIVASRGGFTSPRGVGFLPQALARQLTVEYHAEVTSIEEHADEAVVTWTRPGADERVETCAACVVAVPPPRAVALFAQFEAAERVYLQSLSYSRGIHVAFGLDRPTREQSLLLQVPRAENPDMVAYVQEHNQAADRVPPGTGLVVAHLRGTWAAGNQDLDDVAVIDHVLAETRRLGVVPELEDHTMLTEVFRVWPCTLIRRPGEYRAAARVVHSLRSRRRVHFACGDYLGQSTTNGSLVSGENTAERVHRALRAELSEKEESPHAPA